MLPDRNGRRIANGVVVRPIVGYKANQEGLVVDIDDKVGNITVQFEDEEIYIYHNDKLIIC